MRTLYLECNMGAAGDMLMAALLELIPDREAFIAKMNHLGLPGVEVTLESSVKCGVTGSHVRVLVHGEEELSEDIQVHHLHDHHHDHEYEHHHDHDHEHEHHHDHDHEHHHDHDHEHEHHHDHDHGHDHHHEHSHAHHHHHHTAMADIAALIDAMPVSDKVKADAQAVYQIIAQAESSVHGRPISDIHFHEVGTMDAVADVVGVCLLMEMIGADEIIASPVHVGSGSVRCAHGVLPVPAPATALILSDVPTYGGQVQGELCTPTGAALLKHFAHSFGDRPVMRTQAIGYGMGTKDFERINCVRAFLGETEGKREEITRLECNIDDMTGEALGYASEILLEAGARDVYTTAIGMKKSRPGVMLSVVCLPGDADRMAQLMLKHTTTLGVRRLDCSRYVMARHMETIDTAYGPIRVKYAEGCGVSKHKAEYEDVAKAAKAADVSIQEILNAMKCSADGTCQ